MRRDERADSLKWLEEALLEEEAQELSEEADEFEEEFSAPEFSPRKRRQSSAVTHSRTFYDDEVFDENAAVEDTEPRRKGIGGLLLLALLELAGIVAIAAWWAKCLL